MAMFLPASSDNDVISGTANSSATVRSASPGDTGGGLAAIIHLRDYRAILQPLIPMRRRTPKHDKKISNIHD